MSDYEIVRSKTNKKVEKITIKQDVKFMIVNDEIPQILKPINQKIINSKKIDPIDSFNA